MKDFSNRNNILFDSDGYTELVLVLATISCFMVGREGTVCIINEINAPFFFFAFAATSGTQMKRGGAAGACLASVL